MASFSVKTGRPASRKVFAPATPVVQESLRTRDPREAERLIHAKNEAQAQPGLALHIARAYLAAADPATRLATSHTHTDSQDQHQTAVPHLTGQAAKRRCQSASR